MSCPLDIQGIDALPADRLPALEEHVRCRLSGRLRDFQLTIRDRGLL